MTEVSRVLPPHEPLPLDYALLKSLAVPAVSEILAHLRATDPGSVLRTIYRANQGEIEPATIPFPAYLSALRSDALNAAYSKSEAFSRFIEYLWERGAYPGTFTGLDPTKRH